MKKFYYLDKNLLIQGSQHVLLESLTRLSVSDLNDRFGIGRWVEYVGTHLPSGMRYNPSTNKIEIMHTGSPRERQHLVALPDVIGNFYGPHNFDPGGLLSKNADIFPKEVLFAQGMSISHGYGITSYKKDGTPVGPMLKVLEDGRINISPGETNTSLFEGDLEVSKGVTVGGTLKVRDNLLITGTNPPLDLLGLYKSVKEISVNVAGITDLVPLGAICAFMSENLPVGWALCDGRLLDPDLYSEFIAATGFTRVPDLRGKFIRGWAGSSGYDVGREINTVQEDAGRNITGEFGGLIPTYSGGRKNPYVKGAFKTKNGFSLNGDWGWIVGNGSDATLAEFNAKYDWTEVHTAEEFRPINVSLVYAIKVRIPKNKEDAEAIRISEILFSLDNKLNHTNPQTLDGSLNVSGNVHAKIVKPKSARARSKFVISGGGDYAEFFRMEDLNNISLGDVITVDSDNTYKKACYPDRALGIVSSTAAFTLGNPHNALPVAMMGRVWANVDKDNYSVTKGSVLALDKKRPGLVDVWDGKFKRDILGIALSFVENGKVLVLVK